MRHLFDTAGAQRLAGGHEVLPHARLSDDHAEVSARFAVLGALVVEQLRETLRCPDGGQAVPVGVVAEGSQSRGGFGAEEPTRSSCRTPRGAITALWQRCHIRTPRVGFASRDERSGSGDRIVEGQTDLHVRCAASRTIQI